MEWTFYLVSFLKALGEIRISVRASTVSNVYFVVDAKYRERRNTIDLNGDRRPFDDFRFPT